MKSNQLQQVNADEQMSRIKSQVLSKICLVFTRRNMCILYIYYIYTYNIYICMYEHVCIYTYRYIHKCRTIFKHISRLNNRILVSEMRLLSARCRRSASCILYYQWLSKPTSHPMPSHPMRPTLSRGYLSTPSAAQIFLSHSST